MTATVPPAKSQPVPEGDVVQDTRTSPDSVAEKRAALMARSPLGREDAELRAAPAPAETATDVRPASESAVPAPAPPSLPQEEEDPDLNEIPKSQRGAYAKAYHALLSNPELKSTLALKVAEITARSPVSQRDVEEPVAQQAQRQADPAMQSVLTELRELKAREIVREFQARNPEFATDAELRARTLEAIKQDQLPLEKAYKVALAERILNAHQAAQQKAPPTSERQTAGSASGEMSLETLSEMVSDTKRFKRTEDAVAFAFREAQRRGLRPV